MTSGAFDSTSAPFSFSSWYLAGGAKRMSAHGKTARRFSFLLSPGWIVFGYLLALFAATAAVVSFPFSSIALALLGVVVGAFALVAIPVTLMAYVLMVIALFRAFVELGRWLLLGSGHSCEWSGAYNPCPSQKSDQPVGTDSGLWDRWIDA